MSKLSLSTATGVETFADWLEGLDRVGRRLYELDGELWSEFAEFHREFLRRVEHLEYEGHLSRTTAATDALAVQEREFTGAGASLEKVLHQVQARLGVTVFRAQFVRSSGESRRRRTE